MDRLEVIGLVVLGGLVLLWPASTVWAALDARSREQSLWLPIGIGIGLLWPWGLLAWILLRPDHPAEGRP